MAQLLGADRTGTRGCMAIAVCCALHAVNTVHAAELFKRLNAAEIRAQIVGHVVTDGGHWSDRFEPDGTLKAIDLGVSKPGTWKLQGNDMCVVRKARKPVTECFEIWVFRGAVEYRRDGITLTSGMLRNE